MHRLFIIILLPLFINCSATLKFFNENITEAEGAYVKTAPNNSFAPVFNFYSHDFMVSEIRKDSSPTHAWLTQGPLFTSKQADSLITNIPIGGRIKLTDYEEEYNIDGKLIRETFLTDTLLLFSIPEHHVISSTRRQNSMEVRELSSGRRFTRSVIIDILESQPDTLMIFAFRRVHTLNYSSDSIRNAWALFKSKPSHYQ